MATVGHIEEFQEEKEECTQYVDIDHRATQIFPCPKQLQDHYTNNDKKRPVFLTVIGVKAGKHIGSYKALLLQ